MGSSVMCPLTLGAMPTKFARRVAASVSGRFSHRQNAITIAATAPTRMSAPIMRPSTRRHPADASSGSAMGSATEHAQPDDESDEDDQARIYEHSRPQVRVEPGTREELPAHHGPEDAEHEGRHPGGKVRASHRDVGAWPAARQQGASGHRVTTAKARPTPTRFSGDHGPTGPAAGAEVARP